MVTEEAKEEKPQNILRKINHGLLGKGRVEE